MTDPDRARTLLSAARTLASIVLPGPIIDTALKEATMPILIRDTPFGREMYQEGRQEGERDTVIRITRATLVHRFGDDPRVDAVAERLAALPDEQRVSRIAAAADLADLEN